MEAALHVGSLLAAGLRQPLSENSRPGHQLSTVALYLGIGFINSNTATGLRVCLYDDGRRSRDTGKERDSESGLDYFGARYYGSALGRFTNPDWSKTPDPIPYADLGNPQSLNLYTYVLNRPLTSFDRDGHTHQECGPDTWDPQSHTVTAHCHDAPDWYNLWTRFQNWNKKNNDEWNKRNAAHQPPPQARNKENLLNDINDVAMGMIPTTSPFRSLYRRFYEETKRRRG